MQSATNQPKAEAEPPASTERIKQLADYIVDKVIKRKGVEVTEDTSLVSSGLIDSFA